MQNMILIEFCGNVLSITPYIGFFQDVFNFQKNAKTGDMHGPPAPTYVKHLRTPYQGWKKPDFSGEKIGFLGFNIKTRFGAWFFGFNQVTCFIT